MADQSSGRTRGERRGDASAVKIRGTMPKRSPRTGQLPGEINYDSGEGILTGQHKTDDYNITGMNAIYSDLIEIAKRQDRTSRVKKLQRAQQQTVEAGLILRTSWCPTCINFLHNCICIPDNIETGASVAFVDRALGRQPHEEVVARRKEVAKRERKERKEAQRQLRQTGRI